MGAIWPGYSHVAQPISALGAVGAPNATIQDINFVVTGLLFVAFAYGLHWGIGGGKGSRVGPSLIALSGVLWLLDGPVFPLDGPGIVTPVGIIHVVVGLSSFVALTIAVLVLSRRLRKDGQWQSYGSYSRVTGLLMIVFFIVYMAANRAESLNVAYYSGVTQRLLVGAFLLWMEVMATRLFRISSSPYRVADTTHLLELPA